MAPWVFAETNREASDPAVMVMDVELWGMSVNATPISRIDIELSIPSNRDLGNQCTVGPHRRSWTAVAQTAALRLSLALDGEP